MPIQKTTTLSASTARKFTETWYQKHYLRFLLAPGSGLFRCIVAVRRQLYKIGMLKTTKFAVPVIVVGNITVGGSGKTPLVIWLAAMLKTHGMQPGIVSRGYGGSAQRYPQWVDLASDPSKVGDEPLLIAKRTGCPTVVDPNRVRAVTALLQKTNCNIVISDDGLQHYALARDIEIAVIDGERRLGNQYCLPAGPLREPVSRLQNVDFVVVSGTNKFANEYSMLLQPSIPINLANPSRKWSRAVASDSTVHAVAGIGNPQRFFRSLQQFNLAPIEHVFADHYPFAQTDFNFSNECVIIMTEKDAMKCQTFADERFWYLPINAELEDIFKKNILTTLSAIIA